MTTVLVFGTFDVIHPGHEWFLRQAAALGDRLVAVVSRDDFVRDWKGKPPVRNEQERMEALKAAGMVDQVILADQEIRTYGVVKSIKPDIICLGHDQKALRDDLEHWLGHEIHGGPAIRILPPWKRHAYSSTRLNRRLRGAGTPESLHQSGLLVFLLVVAMVTYGFSWVSGKRISTVLSPATLACIRFFITFLCFLPFAAVRRIPENRRRVSPGGWLKTAAAAVMIAAYNILFFIGLRSGLAGKGGLIVTTMNPLVTALILLLMRRDRPGTLAVLGLSAGIAGGILLFEPWHFPMSVILKSGNLAFLGAAAAWSLLTIISRSAQKTMGFRNFNSGLYALATLLMLPFAAAEIRSGFPQGLTPAFWGDMLFISIGVGAFGTGVYFAASSRLGAAKTSSFTYLVPVSALIFTYLFLGERPDPSMIAGGVLAVAAVILVNRPAGRERLPD